MGMFKFPIIHYNSFTIPAVGLHDEVLYAVPVKLINSLNFETEHFGKTCYIDGIFVMVISVHDYMRLCQQVSEKLGLTMHNDEHA